MKLNSITPAMMRYSLVEPSASRDKDAMPSPTAQPRKPKICNFMRPKLSDSAIAKMMPTMSSDVVSAAASAEWIPLAIIFAIALSDSLGRIKLQIFGFLGCAVGLGIASLSLDADGSTRLYLIMAGVMLFNFMTNIGPNAQTYLLAGEVFPTEVRGMGAGFAAMIGKVGAVATTYGFPILLVSIGTRSLLYGLVISSVLGAVVTWMYRIETTGVNLDRIGR